MARCVFFSPFQREECRRRIEGATEPDTLFTMIKLGTGVVARLSDTGFRLRMRRALPRYGLEHLAYGQYRATSGGSVIEIQVRLHPFARIVAVVWFIGLALLGGKEFVLGVLQLVTRKQWSPKAIPWSATLILPFLFADVRRPRSLDTRYSASPNSFGMPILAKTLALSIPLHLSLQQTYWAPYLLPRS